MCVRIFVAVLKRVLLDRCAHVQILSYPFDSENYPIPLNFSAAAAGSRLFSAAGAPLMHVLATQNVTMNNHHYGVPPANFAANAYLPRMFALLSTNVDRAGLPFVSTMEGKNRVRVSCCVRALMRSFACSIQHADHWLTVASREEPLVSHIPY